MDIKTYIRPENKKDAEKILRKGRGAWGSFVNGAFQTRREIDRLAEFIMATCPEEIQGGSAVDVAIRLIEKDYEKSKESKNGLE